MTVTEAAIENLAEAFCRMGKTENRAIYTEALQSIARIAQAELIHQMQLDFVTATKGPVH